MSPQRIASGEARCMTREGYLQYYQAQTQPQKEEIAQ